MAEKERSTLVTVVLCVALIALNYWVGAQTYSYFNWLTLWPFAFILCAVIASRIWHGHNTL